MPVQCLYYVLYIFLPSPRRLTIESLWGGDHWSARGEGEGYPWWGIVVARGGGDLGLPASVRASIKAAQATVRTVPVSLPRRPAGGGTVSTLGRGAGRDIRTGASRVREDSFVQGVEIRAGRTVYIEPELFTWVIISHKSQILYLRKLLF